MLRQNRHRFPKVSFLHLFFTGSFVLSCWVCGVVAWLCFLPIDHYHSLIIPETLWRFYGFWCTRWLILVYCLNRPINPFDTPPNCMRVEGAPQSFCLLPWSRLDVVAQAIHPSDVVGLRTQPKSSQFPVKQRKRMTGMRVATGYHRSIIIWSLYLLIIVNKFCQKFETYSEW